MKKHFLLKLVPCRPSFAQDMNEEEKKIMQAHSAYLRDWMNKGRILLFGPVLDPLGAYGLGIAAVDHEDEVTEITKNDPATALHKYEFYPLLATLPESKPDQTSSL
jgi:uncharacterized protein YciI